MSAAGKTSLRAALSATAVLGTFLAVAAAPLPHAAAADAAEEEPAMTCLREGHVKLSVGLTMEPRDFSFDEIGSFAPCLGSAADGLTGTIHVVRGPRTYAHGSCTGAVFDVPLTVRWSDGTTSTGHAVGAAAGPVLTATGEITGGRFAGRAYTTRVVLAPQHPELCFSTGVTEIDYRGDITS